MPSTFAFDAWRGELAAGHPVADLEAAVRHVTDPGSATETIHWGRNYLYRTELPTADGGTVDVVVKQFRNSGTRKRAERRLKGSKAERSWRMARAFVEAGIPTAEPLMLIESTAEDGPSFFVTRFLKDHVEARYIFRAVHEDDLDERFPGFHYPYFLSSLGTALRRMHDTGLFHRDLSIGNVLLPKGVSAPTPESLVFVDLNRGRKKASLGLRPRVRDLCRLTIYPRHHQRRFVEAYREAGEGPGGLFGLWWLYRLYHHGFRFKIEGKKKIRAPFRGLASLLAPRRAHAHIPEAPKEASGRDKIVWDHLSDQPHQHAGKLEKLKVRLADAPSHGKSLVDCLAATPAVWRRYRELKEGLYREPLPWQGVGICVRPYPEDPEGLSAAIDDLGVRHVLLRLHPWQEEHDDEEALARALHQKGYDLVFSLPQNRDLVRNPELWERRIEELARRFTPFGRDFQVGQAVNRSKWGVWRYGEYLELARRADRVLRRYPEVRTYGPAVIDFELYSTVSILRSRGCPRFDGLASLLYVDRRGAPENRQLGFDTVDKVLLCRAISETAGDSCGDPSWITEVNWPLWEGPHSPAGKSVSVSEDDQAAFLARFYILALTTGATERVYWWQLIARGYGLVAPRDADSGAGLRRRPAFRVLQTLNAELRGATVLGRRPSPEGTYLFEFQRPKDRILAGWSTGEPCDLAVDSTLGGPVVGAKEQDGSVLNGRSNTHIRLVNTVRFFSI